jgi:general secretion pathway protein N
LTTKTRNRWFIAVGILAYIIFLLALFPVSLIQKWIVPAGLPVQVVAASGTLWHADLKLNHPELGSIDASWQIKPARLLVGKLAAELQIKHPEFKASARVSASPAGVVNLRDVKLFISPGVVNRFIAAQGASLSGDIDLNNAEFSFDVPNRKTLSAQGRIIWQGGRVTYRVGAQNKSAQLPILLGNIHQDAGQLLLSLTTTEGDELASGQVKPDGWAGIGIKRRLIDVVGESWPSTAPADATVFEASHKIF